MKNAMTNLASGLRGYAATAMFFGVASTGIFASAPASADNGWRTLQIVDMTSGADLSADMIVTTGFLDELDVVAFEEPELALATDGLGHSSVDQASKSGWSGVVEVDIKDDSALAIPVSSAFSDTFATDERETKVSGFYTMRYQFKSDTGFRPYAGAGLGVVGANSATETTGIVAGRAHAGFDLLLNEKSAVFAEYAYVKSGGVSFGEPATGESAASIADGDHSVRFGFRRTF